MRHRKKCRCLVNVPPTAPSLPVPLRGFRRVPLQGQLSTDYVITRQIDRGRLDLLASASKTACEVSSGSKAAVSPCPLSCPVLSVPDVNRHEFRSAWPLAAGCDPSTQLVMRHAGADFDALCATVDHAAKLTVDENPRPRFRQWHPLTWDRAPPIAPIDEAANAPQASKARTRGAT
jgi:hypothetical protein